MIRSLLFLCVSLSFAGLASAAVSVGHVENATVGQFLTSAGAVPTAGGVTVGIFTSTAPSSFSGITSYADLVAAGYVDVRSMSGASFAGLDWDFPGTPNAASGTVSGISLSSLPAGTQIYVFGFNGGTFANGFAGSTEFAAVKDDANTGPTDLGSESVLLSSASGTGEILFGTDNGVNVNMASLTAVPEPSRAVLLGLGAVGLMIRRRRKA